MQMDISWGIIIMSWGMMSNQHQSEGLSSLRLAINQPSGCSVSGCIDWSMIGWLKWRTVLLMGWLYDNGSYLAYSVQCIRYGDPTIILTFLHTGSSIYVIVIWSFPVIRGLNKRWFNISTYNMILHKYGNNLTRKYMGFRKYNPQRHISHLHGWAIWGPFTNMD